MGVAPWAFDGDVDDKVSENHCSGGTNCTAGGGDQMRFDYIGVPSGLDSCSDYYSSSDIRRAGCSDADEGPAAAAAVGGAMAVGVRHNSRHLHCQTALGFDSESGSDSEPARESARPAAPRNWNCSVSRLIPAVALE